MMTPAVVVARRLWSVATFPAAEKPLKRERHAFNERVMEGELIFFTVVKTVGHCHSSMKKSRRMSGPLQQES